MPENSNSAARIYGKSGGSRMSRARGPQRPRQAYGAVTSSTATPSGACSRIHARSCWPNAVPVTMRNRSSASRVTVKSHSIPPRGFSIEVYVIAPTSRATRFAQRCSRKSAAPSPAISILANDVSSKSAALAAGEVLGADRGRPEASRPAARAQRLVAARCIRLEPVRALPARLLAEGGAELLQPRVGRGDEQRPARLSLVPGVLDVVVRRVDLGRARERVLARVVVAAEAARVHLPGVERRRPSTIHSATSCPIPPAPASPCAQKPAAVQRPRTSVGPRMNSPSGVNASGPLISRTTSISASDGTRTTAFSISSSKRGQSSASSLPLKSGGMPSSDHGAGWRS